MRKISLIILTLVVGISLSKLTAESTIQRDDLNLKFLSQQFEIGIEIETPFEFKKYTEDLEKFKNLKNKYKVVKEDKDYLKNIEMVIIPFKHDSILTASEFLDKFISSFVTSEYRYKTNVSDEGNIASTSFSIFSDGEVASVESYAVAKEGNKFIVLIQGYYKSLSSSNAYQEKIFEKVLRNISFKHKYNEENFNTI